MMMTKRKMPLERKEEGHTRRRKNMLLSQPSILV
jgi:hypothetical protein